MHGISQCISIFVLNKLLPCLQVIKLTRAENVSRRQNYNVKKMKYLEKAYLKISLLSIHPRLSVCFGLNPDGLWGLSEMQPPIYLRFILLQYLISDFFQFSTDIIFNQILKIRSFSSKCLLENWATFFASSICFTIFQHGCC